MRLTKPKFDAQVDGVADDLEALMATNSHHAPHDILQVLVFSLFIVFLLRSLVHK